MSRISCRNSLATLRAHLLAASRLHPVGTIKVAILMAANHDLGRGLKLLVALVVRHLGLARTDKKAMVIATVEVAQPRGHSKADLRRITEAMVHHLAAMRLHGSRLLHHPVATMVATADILATIKVGMRLLHLLGCRTCCSNILNSKHLLLHLATIHHHLLTGMLHPLLQVMQLLHLHLLEQPNLKGDEGWTQRKSGATRVGEHTRLQDDSKAKMISEVTLRVEWLCVLVTGARLLDTMEVPFLLSFLDEPPTMYHSSIEIEMLYLATVSTDSVIVDRE